MKNLAALSEIAHQQRAAVAFARAGAVGWIVLDRPERRNALTLAMQARMREILASAAADAEVGAVVLTGASDVFCAGADLAGLEDAGSGNAEHRLAEMIETCLAFIDFPKPLVAAVNGPAVGSGCMLALLADARVASPKASFALPEILLGRPTYAGVVLATRMIGEAGAADMVLSGRAMPAQEAMSRGLLQAVVADEALRDAAGDLAAGLSAHAPAAFALNKRWLRRESRALLAEAVAESRRARQAFADAGPDRSGAARQ